MDDLDKALSNITARVQEISANVDENAKHDTEFPLYSNEQITQDISELFTDIQSIYAIFSEMMLALPTLSSIESIPSVPSKLDHIATSIDALIRSQDAKGNFNSLCEEMLRVSRLYKKTWNVAHIAEITAMAQLARYPALLSFPSRTAGLSMSVASAIREQLNDCIAPEPPVSLERVLLLTKGLLLTDQYLESHSVIWFLTKGCLGISKKMSDSELEELVKIVLARRAEAVKMAEKRLEGILEAEFRDWDESQVYCCNIFRTVDAETFSEEYREKFEDVQRKWCLVCGCEFCLVVSDE
jgi:hypothetical protein